VRKKLRDFNNDPRWQQRAGTRGVRWDLHKSWGLPFPKSWIELSFELPEHADMTEPDREEEV
jgi:hypothetical protein